MRRRNATWTVAVLLVLALEVAQGFVVLTRTAATLARGNPQAGSASPPFRGSHFPATAMRASTSEDETDSSSSSSSFPPPPTPCVRICRYNRNFYDGQVCIGCFRETFDIAQWVNYDATARRFALEDALDRWDGNAFEGSIAHETLEAHIEAYQQEEK